MRRESRFSALWGTGSKGGKEILTGALTLVALALPLAAGAEPGRGNGNGAGAFVPAGLLKKAERDQDATFRVIVQGEGKGRSPVAAEGGRVKREFETIDAVAAELTGKQLAKLARHEGIEAITEDAAVGSSHFNDDYWPYLAQVNQHWPSKQNSIQAATIAIVDSGVDSTRPDLAGRVLEQVVLTSLVPNSPGDGRGHGTFVASMAAGEAFGHTGVAPNANIVSLDVLNDLGEGRVSDVIAACDWILANKARLGIRVANFSLHAANPSSFRFDPLDKAVESLWFSGVVVVTSAGNHGSGSESRVPYAPANDPFVITVGAMDYSGTTRQGDDIPAPWSAFGYTLDGFRKPELGAPGRNVVAAVPPGSTMALARPDRVVAPGYMKMSGTSFAAPVIAGSAAVILAVHPDWTPDQVKGALMKATDPLYGPGPAFAIGVGRVDQEDAVLLSSAPNPNAALNSFLVPDPNGGPIPVFDAAAWYDAAWSDAAWDSAAWSDAAWSDAAWNSAAWSDAAWSDAAWSDAAWSDAAWADAAWADLLWVD